MRAITPAAKFSTTTSLFFTKRCTISAPAAERMASRKPRFPWLYSLEEPAPFGPGRVSANGGIERVTQGRFALSSRMTSAPRCASWSVENGPAQAHEKSITLTPSRGGLAIGSLLGSRLACEQLSVVLSEARRRPADGVGAHPRAERHGRDPVGARDRMSHVGEEASALQVLVRVNLSHAIHRGEG